MTLKGHGVIRGHRDLLYDPKGQLDLWLSLWPQKVTGSLVVAMTYFMTLKVNLTLFMTQKVTGSLDVAVTYFMTLKVTGSKVVNVTYFMTPKVTVTFVVGLTYCMTTKGHGVIRGRLDLLYDPKGQLHLWHWPSLWPWKVTGSSEVAVTYFMTPKVNLTFDLDYDP